MFSFVSAYLEVMTSCDCYRENKLFLPLGISFELSQLADVVFNFFSERSFQMNFLCCWNDGPQLQNRLCNIHVYFSHFIYCALVL